MTILYSHNGARPEPLPFRITLPNGFTRTDPSTFTEEEITTAGYTGPYTEPPYDPATQQLDWVDGTYIITNKPLPPTEPDWQKFAHSVMRDGTIKSMLSLALSSEPGIYGGLSVGLYEASKGGNFDLFLSSWGLGRHQGLISQECVDTIIEYASRCNLPQDFTDGLKSVISLE